MQPLTLLKEQAMRAGLTRPCESMGLRNSGPIAIHPLRDSFKSLVFKKLQACTMDPLNDGRCESMSRATRYNPHDTATVHEIRLSQLVASKEI